MSAIKPLLCGCTDSQSCPEHIFPRESTPLKSCFDVGSEQTAEEEDRVVSLMQLGERDGGGNKCRDWGPMYTSDPLEEEILENDQ